MIRRAVLLAHLAAAMCCLSAFAQQSTIAKVVFRDAGPYAQADLESAAGVHPGQKMTLADMQTAAQHLVDTGCFDNVVLDSHGTPGALTLIFVLKPSGTGVVHQIAFENFVWFTPDELMTIARKVDPLVGSGLPEGGAVLDSISDALQAALAAKGVSDSQVGHTLVLPSSARPVSLIVYRVNKPFVVLGAVRLTGVAPDFAPALREREAMLQGKPYESEPSNGTQSRLMRPYLDAGYLDAQLVDVQTSLGAPKPGLVGVDLSARVDAGALYHVAALHFSGDPVVPAEAFAAASTLHAGDVASRAKLLETIKPIDTAYHRLGYMDEYVNSGAHLDPASHTVSYDFKVMPGEIYYVHTVTVQGLPADARAQFDQAWKLTSGKPYNAEYATTFVTSEKDLRFLRGYAGGFSAAADPATHQVDLTVNFLPLAGK